MSIQDVRKCAARRDKAQRIGIDTDSHVVRKSCAMAQKGASPPRALLEKCANKGACHVCVVKSPRLRNAFYQTKTLENESTNVFVKILRQAKNSGEKVFIITLLYSGQIYSYTDPCTLRVPNPLRLGLRRSSDTPTINLAPPKIFALKRVPQQLRG